MSARSGDPLRQIAERVADCFSEHGYAFVEEDKLEALAALLGSFLLAADIPVHRSGDDTPQPP